ncbi:hypothetical protein BYT27DRAFT_7265566 [Phlegmacium glaucopus]|nr:hypothetical protein BYT27DRAFT_7265566 [Phlegmacium glaucopus]
MAFHIGYFCSPIADDAHQHSINPATRPARRPRHLYILLLFLIHLLNVRHYPVLPDLSTIGTHHPTTHANLYTSTLILSIIITLYKQTYLYSPKLRHTPRLPDSAYWTWCLRKSKVLHPIVELPLSKLGPATATATGYFTFVVASRAPGRHPVFQRHSPTTIRPSRKDRWSLAPFFDVSTFPEFRQQRDGSRSASFRIPWTKTTREQGATVILTARPDVLCPVLALKNHLDINTSIPQSSALFAYKSPSGPPKNLLKHEFLKFVTSIWSLAMLTHVLGHSFRIGGAVKLLLAGVPPKIVAATGGWTSLAFLLYWRRMEEILPMSTSKAYNKTHIDNLAMIFEQFRINNNIPTALSTASDSNITL